MQNENSLDARGFDSRGSDRRRDDWQQKDRRQSWPWVTDSNDRRTGQDRRLLERRARQLAAQNGHSL